MSAQRAQGWQGVRWLVRELLREGASFLVSLAIIAILAALVRSFLDPIVTWMTLAVALVLSSLIGMTNTSRALWRAYWHGDGWLDLPEARVLAQGHVRRESIRLFSGGVAFALGLPAWGRTTAWSPGVTLLVWLLASLLVNSVIDQVDRHQVRRLAVRRARLATMHPPHPRRRATDWPRGPRNGQ